MDPVVLQQVQARAEQQAELTQTRESRIRTEQQQDQERRFGTESFEQQLQRAVRQLNETSDLFQIRLRFKIDEERGDIYVLVIDREKGEIIRRIPPEKVISMVYQLEYMIGLLLDELV